MLSFYKLLAVSGSPRSFAISFTVLIMTGGVGDRQWACQAEMITKVVPILIEVLGIISKGVVTRFKQLQLNETSSDVLKTYVWEHHTHYADI